jgi:membrane-associated phospholipid phosphatase
LASDRLCWALGTARYYPVPSLGPRSPFPGAAGVQSVAAFASLHVAITLMMALVGSTRSRSMQVTLWGYFGVTTVSTTYFGWHYLVDDFAGALIAVVSFYVGARSTGQTFSRVERDSARSMRKQSRPAVGPEPDSLPVASRPERGTARWRSRRP